MKQAHVSVETNLGQLVTNQTLGGLPCEVLKTHSTSGVAKKVDQDLLKVGGPLNNPKKQGKEACEQKCGHIRSSRKKTVKHESNLDDSISDEYIINRNKIYWLNNEATEAKKMWEIGKSWGSHIIGRKVRCWMS